MIEFPVLGIDTAKAACSKCVWFSDASSKPVVRNVHDSAANLVVEIDKLCAGRRPVSLVWVCGPGSYTGLRIGWCVVRTISFVWGCPIWSVESVEVEIDIRERINLWNPIDGPLYELEEKPKS